MPSLPWPTGMIAGIVHVVEGKTPAFVECGSQLPPPLPPPPLLLLAWNRRTGCGEGHARTWHLQSAAAAAAAVAAACHHSEQA